METESPGVACEGSHPEPASSEARTVDGGLAELVQDIAEVPRQRGYHVGRPITCSVENGSSPRWS